MRDYMETVMAKRRILCAVLSMIWAGAVAGCGSDERRPGDTIEREGQPPVAYVDDEDPSMAAAIKKARSTVDQFIEAFNDPKPSQSDFGVKLLIEDGDHGEHMWILPMRYEDGKFTGTIQNEPDRLRNVQFGDEVDVAKEEISDWMYVDNGKLVGGYTLRVLRERMSEEERQELDRSVPFSIE